MRSTHPDLVNLALRGTRGDEYVKTLIELMRSASRHAVNVFIPVLSLAMLLLHAS